MPAVWLPYGSTSISIRVEPDDLAWVLPRGVNTDYTKLLPELRSVMRELKKAGSLFLIDPTVSSIFRGFPEKNMGVEKLKELAYFDLFPSDSDNGLTFKSACLVTRPHLDPLIGFRGLGENVFPFMQTLWREFTAGFIETTGSGGTVDLKPYLARLCSEVDLKLVMLISWSDSYGVLVTNSPVEAYDALKGLQQKNLLDVDPVENLLVSAGGNPFDESLYRAMCILPNCLRNVECDRVLLAFQAENGLGLDPDRLIGEKDQSDDFLIFQYFKLCNSLLDGKTVHVASSVPEPLLNTILECKAYDTLLDAYKASRLFMPKGSKIGVVTDAPFTSLSFKKGVVNGLQAQ